MMARSKNESRRKIGPKKIINKIEMMKMLGETTITPQKEDIFHGQVQKEQ